MIKIGSPIGRAIILTLALAVPCGSLAFAQKSTTTNDQDAPPIAGDSGFTSPLNGTHQAGDSDEAQFFSDLLDAYHFVLVAQENLRFAKLCGSKQDIDKAEAELKDETDAFNKMLEKYIYLFPPPPKGPFNYWGETDAKKFYGNPKNQSSAINSIGNYDRAVNWVMEALAKESKPVLRHSGCGDQAVTTPPLPPKPKDHPSPPHTGSGEQLVNGMIGVVMPTDTRAGDRFTATVVQDPQNYEGVPGLKVLTATVPLMADAQGNVSLQGLVVDTGHKMRQPAEIPLLVNVAKDAHQISLQFKRRGEDKPLAVATAAVEDSTSYPILTEEVSTPPSPLSSAYTTPPAYPSGGIQDIHGPLSGNSEVTHVLLDDKPGPIIAENPRSVYFKLPDNTAPGAHTVTLKEGTRTLSTFQVAVIWLKVSADLLALKRGQSTAMHATILGANSIPASAWRMGIEKGLVDPKEAGAMVLANTGTEWCWLKGCSPDKPGAIALSIENKSPETVKLIDAKGEKVTKLLGREDFSNGSYTFNGKLKSVRDGKFDISLRVTPLLAPIEGEAPAKANNPPIASSPDESRRSAERVPSAPPSFATPVELPHLIAYFVQSTDTLHIRNQAHLLQGIAGGKFAIQWKSGEASAQLQAAGKHAITAQVALDDADVPPVGEPHIGDVKFVEREDIMSHNEHVFDCRPGTNAEGEKVGLRSNVRQYTYLAGDGKESGTEIFNNVMCDNVYRIKDCSAGYYDAVDFFALWTLTVGPWPNP